MPTRLYRIIVVITAPGYRTGACFQNLLPVGNKTSCGGEKALEGTPEIGGSLSVVNRDETIFVVFIKFQDFAFRCFMIYGVVC